MQKFLDHYASEVKGVLSGWDRLAFRGTLRWLAYLAGLERFLSSCHIQLKNFMPWAEAMTRKVRQGCEQTAQVLGIPTLYLRSSSTDKEETARQIARDRGMETGPICRFSVVEPCWAPCVAGNRASGLLELRMRPRKCVWEYFYFNDPEVGFGHLRLQTWVPFTIKGCLNGRHWLERELLREGIRYVKMGNCFRWIEDWDRAQELFDAQLRTDWPALLSQRMRLYFPVLEGIFPHRPLDYYWSAEETEWATDIAFGHSKQLDRLFPMLARHSMLVTDSASVMRFLGQIEAQASLPGHVTGDLRGDRRRRHEGVRVKHNHGGNSVKMYNKAGNVLRVETTINAPRGFKVWREDTHNSQGGWAPMRKGVADLHRRAQVSQKSNERYLDALSACSSEATLQETVAQVCRARKNHDKRGARALNPWSQKDHRVLAFLAQGEWAVNGLRNRDLAAWLDLKANTGELDPAERRRLSARVSRLLGVLRAHGLIRKVPKTHRYLVTPKGKQVSALVIAASNVQTRKLMEMAA